MSFGRFVYFIIIFPFGCHLSFFGHVSVGNLIVNRVLVLWQLIVFREEITNLSRWWRYNTNLDFTKHRRRKSQKPA